MTTQLAGGSLQPCREPGRFSEMMHDGKVRTFGLWLAVLTLICGPALLLSACHGGRPGGLFGRVTPPAATSAVPALTPTPQFGPSAAPALAPRWHKLLRRRSRHHRHLRRSRLPRYHLQRSQPRPRRHRRPLFRPPATELRLCQTVTETERCTRSTLTALASPT